MLQRSQQPDGAPVGLSSDQREALAAGEDVHPTSEQQEMLQRSQ